MNEQLTISLDELQAELKDTRRQLLVHENYNNPSSQASLFAKKRKEHRRTVKALNEGATLQEAQNSKGKRGRPVGAKGTSPTYKPDLSKTKEFVADICGGCGRIDTIPRDTICKTVVDIGECGAIICYTEKITPVYCDVCRAVTHPATDSIPGTWAGPNLRRIIMNIHGISPTVDGISKRVPTAKTHVDLNTPIFRPQFNPTQTQIIYLGSLRHVLSLMRCRNGQKSTTVHTVGHVAIHYDIL